MSFSTRRTQKPGWDPESYAGCLPTPQQELLLGAALFPESAARDAWRRWRTHIDPEQDVIDPGSHRLLPLVWYNLHAAGLDDPFLDGIKDHCRHTIAFNQRQLYGCSQMLTRLHQAEIATLVLKGAALVTDHYPDMGMRPIGDCDVLVRHSQASTALDILHDDGWWGGKPRELLTGEFLHVRHAENLVNAKGHQCDLHWHALVGSMNQKLDAELWDAARPLRIHNVQTHTLCPTDQLLHICVHGAAWAPMPPLRWIPDAVMVLRGTEAIDWDRLVRLAQTYALSLPMHLTLNYLQTSILPHLAPGADGQPFAVPAAVLTTLAQTPTTANTRRLFHAHTHRSSTWGQFPLIWARYQTYRARRQRQIGAAPLNFLQYIAAFYGYAGIPDVMRWAVTRSAQRLGKLGGRLLDKVGGNQSAERT